MAEIRHINALRAQKNNNNTLITPLQVLEDAAEDIRQGELVCDKLVVIALSTEDDRYITSYYASNIRTSEIVALLEAMKSKFLRFLMPTGD